MTLEDRLRSHLHATPEPEVDPGPSAGAIASLGRRRQRRRQVGSVVAGAVVAVGLVGGAAALLDDDTPASTDIASTANAPEAAEELGVGEGADLTATADPAETAEAESGALPGTESVTELVVPAFGIETVVGVGGGFAGLRTEPGEIAVFITSPDGTTWTETATTGLGVELFTTAIDHYEGTFVALFESFEGAGPATQLVTQIGVSANGVDWELRELDAGAAADEAAFFSGSLAVGPSGVLTTATVQAVYVDPLEVALELGVLTDDQYENFCGWDLTVSGEPIGLFACPTSAEDTGESLEVFATLEPSDPGYDEVARVLFVEETASSRSVALTGPLEGPLRASPLPLELFGVESTAVGDGSFAVAAFAFEDRVVLTSPDGVDWTVEQRVPTLSTVAAVLGFGPDVLTAVADSDGLTIDGVPIALTEPIAQVWGLQSAVGPAGAALLVSGDDGEPFLDPSAAESGPVILDEGAAAEDAPPLEEPLVVEPGQVGAATQLHALLISVDGATWTELDIDRFVAADDFPSLAAVGDDEVLLRVNQGAGPATVRVPIG